MNKEYSNIKINFILPVIKDINDFMHLSEFEWHGFI